MTSEELKDLKTRLWQTADQLRVSSGLKSSQYSAPILGLIFLRFADSKYSIYEDEILEEYNKTKGTRAEKQIREISTIKCGFYLPEIARYETLLNLPEEENLEEKIKEPMTDEEVQVLLSKTADDAKCGQFEMFKTTYVFDGTARNPQWRGEEPDHLHCLIPE